MKRFLQAEQGFEKLFGYNCQYASLFDYQNVLKNGSISEQLELQKQELQSDGRKTEGYQDSKSAFNLGTYHYLKTFQFPSL